MIIVQRLCMPDCPGLGSCAFDPEIDKWVCPVCGSPSWPVYLAAVQRGEPPLDRKLWNTYSPVADQYAEQEVKTRAVTVGTAPSTARSRSATRSA